MIAIERNNSIMNIPTINNYPMQILLIDDDVELGETIKPVLGMYAIDVTTATTPEKGLELLQSQPFELVLLDVMLPQMNGLELCRRIRALPEPLGYIPIIFLSARTELVDKVVGLETGADDYVDKPFEPRELIARIQAVLRRFSMPTNTEVRNIPLTGGNGEFIFTLDGDELIVNLPKAQISVNGNAVNVTSMEFEVLSVLAQARGNILSQDELLTQSKGITEGGIVAIIYRLRNKIHASGAKTEFIRTIRNRGYALLSE